MYSNYAASVGTSVVSNICMVDSTGLQRRIHGQEIKRSKPVEDLVFVSALEIIGENKSLPKLYNFKKNEDVTATFEDLFPSGI